MTAPRQVLPGQFQLITRRCTQGMFLLRPDETTNNIFAYCLAQAAKLFDIDVVLTIVESNHHHTIIYDRHGRFSEFMHYLHTMVARCMNERWGRSENLWSAVEPCVTRLLDTSTVMKELIYAASNPVKDGLVERATQWPGLNGYRALLAGKSVHAKRPQQFFSKRGKMPDELILSFVIPPELGDVASVVRELKEGVEQVEREMEAKRMQAAKRGEHKARVVGLKRLLAQPWNASPSKPPPHGGLRPRFAGLTDNRVDALVAYKAFLMAYHEARKLWLAGEHSVFPAGTYWLRRFARVTVAPLPAS
ncbi:MAG: transposase [Kofleriaceae bacterium]